MISVGVLSELKMAEKVMPHADQVEDEVMNGVPSCDVDQLRHICELIKLTVNDGIKDNRRELRKLVMRTLCDTTTEDDKMPEFLLIHDFLWPDGADDEDADVKTENIETARRGGNETEEVRTSEPDKSKSSSTGPQKLFPRPTPTRPKQTTVHTEITKVRLKEFKLPGMIGGEGENALTYDSLIFEVDNGRKLGYSDTEMCSTIISKTADKETREYFQTMPNIKLEDVLEMLKSACGMEKESSNLFTQFTNDKQGKEEKPLTFITRVLRLRRKVYTLGLEEGSNYDQNMLAKRSLQVIFGGLRDENIRSALRERVKNDHTLEDKVIHKHASEVILAEEERKLKLFGKTPEVAVQQITKSSGSIENPVGKKDKPNPFEKIEELRIENERRCEELRCDLSEIKNILMAKHKREEEEPKKEDEKGKSGKSRFGRCKQCQQDNKFRCFHCWACGQDDHKKGAVECPKN